MPNTDYPLSSEEFDEIYSKVPRLTVEIVLKSETGELYLTKRAIEPCKGQWHLPGGTVYFGEFLQDAVKRIAKRELGVEVKTAKNIGYIEYPSHFKAGLDSPVGLVFEVTSYQGSPEPNKEATEGGWFTELPSPMHADQDKYLEKSRLLHK